MKMPDKKLLNISLYLCYAGRESKEMNADVVLLQRVVTAVGVFRKPDQDRLDRNTGIVGKMNMTVSFGHVCWL